MHVPLVDLTAPLAEVRTELDAALARVIDRARFVLGEELDLFEAAFARSIGVRHAVGCGSGSDALLLSLSALGIGLLITIPMTASANVASTRPRSMCRIGEAELRSRR